MDAPFIVCETAKGKVVPVALILTDEVQDFLDELLTIAYGDEDEDEDDGEYEDEEKGSQRQKGKTFSP